MDPEIPNDTKPEVVLEGGDLLSRRYNKPGSEVDLKEFFGDPTKDVINSEIMGIYIKTKSGNMYRLTSNGMLVNKNESLKRGEIFEDQIPAEILRKAKLKVGEPFSIPGMRSTPVSEVVVVGDTMVGGSSVFPSVSVEADFSKDLPKE